MTGWGTLGERWRWLRWPMTVGMIVLAGVVAVALVVEDPELQRLAGVVGGVALAAEMLGIAWGLRRVGRDVPDLSNPAAVLVRRVQQFEAAQDALVGSPRPADLHFDVIAGRPTDQAGQQQIRNTKPSQDGDGSAASTLPALSKHRLLSRIRRLLRLFAQPDSAVPILLGPHRSGTARTDGHSLAVIDDFFARVHPGALVVLGEPGSGKTVLAATLVSRMLDDPRGPVGGLIPVRIGLAGWNPTQPLRDHVVDRITRDYGLPRSSAADLVERRQVLPVLDGLDELVLPSGLTWSDVLLKLESYLGDSRSRSLVVTCRTGVWDQATATGDTVYLATVIRLKPLQADQVRAFAAGRLRTGSTELHVWNDWLAGLDKESRALLGTPLWLMMAMTIAEAADPLPEVQANLSETDARARLQRDLLAGYVPAATRLTSDGRSGRTYNPERVETWLRQLAHQLRAGQHPGGTGLEPHRLWQAGGRRVRWLHGGFLFLTVALPWWLDNPNEFLQELLAAPGQIADGTYAGYINGGAALSFIVAVSALTVVVFRRGFRAMPEPRVPSRLIVRMKRPPPTAAEISRKPKSRPGYGGAWFGFLLAAFSYFPVLRGDEWVLQRFPLTSHQRQLTQWLFGNAPVQVAARITYCLVTVAGITCMFWLGWRLLLRTVDRLRARLGYGIESWRPDLVLTTPRAALRLDLKMGATTGLTVAVGLGIWSAYFELQDVFNDTMRSTSSWFFYPYLLTIVFVWVVLLRALAWTRYLIGSAVAASRRRLPLRLGAFLDWSVQAGLLRTAGGTYQFRHQEFQEWLAAEPSPNP